jgi:hypothetical protein
MPSNAQETSLLLQLLQEQKVMSDAKGILTKPYNDDPRTPAPVPEKKVEVPVRVIELMREAVTLMQSAVDRQKALEELEKYRALKSRPATEDEVRAQDRPKYIAQYNRLTEKERAEIRRSLYVAPGTCDHLKGGKLRRYSRMDYNLSHHTFISGQREIKCLTCKTKWHPRDAQWKWALKAFETMSTNTKTSSEQPMYAAQFRDRDAEYYYTIEEIQRRYPDWDGVIAPPGTVL